MFLLANPSRNCHADENVSASQGDEESEHDDMAPLASPNQWDHPAENKVHS